MARFPHLYNTQWGQTALIVCNGPSLKDVPREFLQKYQTFGFNNIFLLPGFVSTYYVCCNPLVIVQSKEMIKSYECPMKFIREGYGFTNDYEIAMWDNPDKFSIDASINVVEGHSVTHIALQIAYFLGFRTILIVGCDHRFIYDGLPDKFNVMRGDDPNHFSPDYFKGQVWNNPNLEKSAESFKAAKFFYEKDGRRIVNLTPGTALDVFEKDDIANW